MPVALPAPTALMKAAPWSGPAAAMNSFGVKWSWANSDMNAATVGTSVEPSTTMSGFLPATMSACGLYDEDSSGKTLEYTVCTPRASSFDWASCTGGVANGSSADGYAAVSLSRVAAGSDAM